jgi:hypothetical protein
MTSRSRRVAGFEQLRNVHDRDAARRGDEAGFDLTRARCKHFVEIRQRLYRGAIIEPVDGPIVHLAVTRTDYGALGVCRCNAVPNSSTDEEFVR